MAEFKTHFSYQRFQRQMADAIDAAGGERKGIGLGLDILKGLLNRFPGAVGGHKENRRTIGDAAQDDKIIETEGGLSTLWPSFQQRSLRNILLHEDVRQFVCRHLHPRGGSCCCLGRINNITA